MMESFLEMPPTVAQDLFCGVVPKELNELAKFKVTAAVYEGTPLTPVKLGVLGLDDCRLVKFEADSESYPLRFAIQEQSVDVTMLDGSVVSLPVAGATIVLADGICRFPEGILAAKTTTGYTVCIPTESKFYVVLIYKNPPEKMEKKRQLPKRSRREPQRFGEFKRW